MNNENLEEPQLKFRSALRSNIKRLSPALVATTVAVVYVMAFTAVKYILSKSFDWATATTGAVLLWIIYYFLQKFLNRRIKRRIGLMR